eukprot:NODE_1191_length_1612_cov_53.262626_g1122_i0.p1 GENE.NODE_1191_length_1612_cov_53.262626_g1122_i0~~NODE_1191_length_1612_cov_53.262626_g1122_i0.p1  ORF type:complete len:502 (+),score=67.81 NODE_1191_length_1612_cov_53.262626_g1122_i0:64-1569(+)
MGTCISNTVSCSRVLKETSQVLEAQSQSHDGTDISHDLDSGAKSFLSRSDNGLIAYLGGTDILYGTRPASCPFRVYYIPEASTISLIPQSSPGVHLDPLAFSGMNYSWTPVGSIRAVRDLRQLHSKDASKAQDITNREAPFQPGYVLKLQSASDSLFDYLLASDHQKCDGPFADALPPVVIARQLSQLSSWWPVLGNPCCTSQRVDEESDSDQLPSPSSDSKTGRTVSRTKERLLEALGDSSCTPLSSTVFSVMVEEKDPQEPPSSSESAPHCEAEANPMLPSRKIPGAQEPKEPQESLEYHRAMSSSELTTEDEDGSLTDPPSSHSSTRRDRALEQLRQHAQRHQQQLVPMPVPLPCRAPMIASYGLGTCVLSRSSYNASNHSHVMEDCLTKMVCGLCWKTMHMEQHASLLPCGHLFHSNCVTPQSTWPPPAPASPPDFFQSNNNPDTQLPSDPTSASSSEASSPILAEHHPEVGSSEVLPEQQVSKAIPDCPLCWHAKS